MALPRLTLVLGGARSGKSRMAEGLVSALPPPWIYVATAQALDEEMQARIAAHRARRAEGWRTIEAPLDLASVLDGAPPGAPVLVDCLTLWLTNLLLSEAGPEGIGAAVAALEAALDRRIAPSVLVGNEVGLGIVPDHPLGRRFRDEAGALHQRLAARAERVLFMVAGLPMRVKEEG